MKKRISQITTIAVIFFIALVSAHADNFKNLVVFGDSLSDQGNLFAATSGYPPAPYKDGRFSNGPVWVEYLVQSLDIPGLYLNYAYAGAQTGETNVDGTYPGFLTQIRSYVNQLESSRNYPSAFAMPADTLFVVAIGANDFWQVSDISAAINQAITNIKTGITELLQTGAKNFIITNIPDLGKTPRFNKNNIQSLQASQLIGAFNQSMTQMLDEFETANPDLTLNRVDIFSFLGDIVDNHETMGFSNALDAQLDKDKGTIGEGSFVFWDEVHPTTKTHKLFADIVKKTIVCDTCPANKYPYFQDGFSIKVPYIELQGNAFEFNLISYENPLDEKGLYWKLDPITVKMQ